VDKDQVLAERRLLMRRDGIEEAQEVALQIGMPRQSKGGDEVVCPIAIRGLHDNLPPVRGRDIFNALVQAVRTLRLHCRKPPEGVHFFYFHEPPHDRQPYEGEPWDEEESEAAMRDYDAPYRNDWSVLVERKILMRRDRSAARSEVLVRIGVPYPITRGNVEMTTCPIAITGQDIDWLDHRDGSDLFEALSDAVLHINLWFEKPSRGGFFFWPDGEPYCGDFAHLPPRPRRKRDPRGIAGNWEVLAERTLLMECDGAPKRKQISIRIGRPYLVEEGKWVAFPFEIAGLYDNMGPMRGRDSYEALIYALEFFDRHTRRNDVDTSYFWPDGTPYEGEPLYLEPDA
jgi:hypothetical protein